MQKTSILALSVLLISTLIIFNFSFSSTDNNVNFTERQIFENWKAQFNKYYQDDNQNSYRLEIFLQNYREIEQHNIRYANNLQTFEMGLNQFSDLTNVEFEGQYFNSKPIKTVFQCNGPDAPYKTTFDANFTRNGTDMIVNEVGQQGQCSSGYAFATIAAVESAMYKSLKKIQPMSAQQIVDCSSNEGNQGCNGGSSLNSLQYIMAHGTMSLSDYVYTGTKGDCRYNSTKKIWDVDNCTKITSQNISALKSAVLQQPVIVSFDASDSKFKSYKTGVFSNSTTCGDKMTHNLLVVGWGEYQTGKIIKTKVQYLIAKNSFGKTWGENGYVTIQIDTSKDGVCGILKESYTPYL